MKLRVIIPMLKSDEILPEADYPRLEAAAGPGTEISVRFIEHGPRKIESEYEDALAVPGTIEAAQRAEREGMDAVLINCTADTGLAPCREAVQIPVVGPTIAAMHLAAQLAHRFSVLSFLDRVNERFESMAFRWGLAHKLASVRSVDMSVLDILHDDEKLARDLLEASLLCQADGAHAVILGCTAFETVSSALNQLLAQAGVPMLVLEPFPIAVKQAEALVAMGLSHSKLTYPDPDLAPAQTAVPGASR